MLAKNFLEICALTIRALPSGREPCWAEPKKPLNFSGDLKERGS
jgi:hypothetical protein